MDLVILQKIEPSILNGLVYIVCLEKKSGSRAFFLINGLKYKLISCWNEWLGQKIG